LCHLASQPLVLGLATLETTLVVFPQWMGSLRESLAQVQTRTGHLGGLGIIKAAANPEEVLNYDHVSLEVSRIGQLIGWYRVVLKSYVHLCEFMAKSATRSEVLENRGILGCPTSSPASVKHCEIFSELLGADKSRIIHFLDELDSYKELCTIQNQNVGPSYLAKCMKPLI
jgi:hypothetical protein